MFAKLSDVKKNLFFEVLDELAADFNGFSREDRNYLEMRIENNQFFNTVNKKALRNAPLVLRLLKEVYIWIPKTEDEEEIEAKKKELIDLLIFADKLKKSHI